MKMHNAERNLPGRRMASRFRIAHALYKKSTTVKKTTAFVLRMSVLFTACVLFVNKTRTEDAENS
jgi:hypothetical protein